LFDFTSRKDEVSMTLEKEVRDQVAEVGYCLLF
jgi:hypothetical protein